MELEKLRKKVEKHYYKYFKIGNCELSKEDAENIQWGVDVVKSILFGVSSSNRKNTLQNFKEIEIILKEAHEEVENGIYNPIEEALSTIVNKYEIIKK